MNAKQNPADEPVPPVIMTQSSATEESVPSFSKINACKTELKKLKYKIIATIVLGLGCIIGAVLLTYLGLFYWQKSSNNIQIFHVQLNDHSSHDHIRLEIKVDPKDSLEYSRSPQQGSSAQSNDILGLKDFKKGIVAYREENGSKCFIGKIVPQSELQSYANGSIQVADVMQNESYVVLNETIHPFVLQLVAGDYIVEFCGRSAGVWMIPYSHAFDSPGNSTTTKEHTRAKRWGWWYRRSYYHCWWNCTWWGWKKWCTRRCIY